VWTGAAVGAIRSEQWPYQMAKLVSQPSPATRWPALAVNSALPPTDPVRAGQALFVVQCLPCHKLNGAGASNVGLDLNLPQIRPNISRRGGTATRRTSMSGGLRSCC